MENAIFVPMFIGFLARGMIGSFINNLVKTDILLFCKPINILGAMYFVWALIYSDVTPLHAGFFISDVILTTLILLNSFKPLNRL
jgi:hypothetical protein